MTTNVVCYLVALALQAPQACLNALALLLTGVTWLCSAAAGLIVWILASIRYFAECCILRVLLGPSWTAPSQALRAALEYEDPQLLQTVLEVKAGCTQTCVTKSATPDFNRSLRTALYMQESPDTIGKAVRVLLSKPSAAQSISSDVVREVLEAAVCKQYLTVVQCLVKLPAAKAAFGATGSNGKGILCLALTAAADQQILDTLMEGVHASRSKLRSRELSAELKTLWLRTFVAMELLDSAGAVGLSYSDLMAAAETVIPMLARAGCTRELYHKNLAAEMIAARFVSVVAQQGRGTETLLDLIQQHMGAQSRRYKDMVDSTERQWAMLLGVARTWAADMNRASCDLTAAAAEREPYLYAYTSLAAEQKRLVRNLTRSNLLPGQSGPRDCRPSVSIESHSWLAATAIGVCGNLRVAIQHGRKFLIKQLLDLHRVRPSLALNSHGYDLLMLAIGTGDVDMLNLVLQLVATASVAVPEGAFDPTIDVAQLKPLELRLNLALAAVGKGGSDFLLAVHKSGLAPTELEWASEVKAAHRSGDVGRGVACMKGMVLCHKPDNTVTDKTLRVLNVLIGHEFIPASPGALLRAVVESCGSDLRQKVQAASALRWAFTDSQGLAHILGCLAVLRHDIEMIRASECLES